MHEWKKLVRRRLKAASMPLEEEVIAELAAHLEESYAEARSRDLGDRTAIELALQEVDDWHVLATEIRDVRKREDYMTYRTKSLWLPALASFAAASLFLFVLTEISRQPRFLVQLNSGFGRSLYLAWFAAQLLFGAIGAFLSRRAGGTRTARIVAGVFPAIVMFALLAVRMPISAVIEHNAFVLNHPDKLALGILLWAVAPATTLFCGALPFLRGASVQPAQRRAS